MLKKPYTIADRGDLEQQFGWKIDQMLIMGKNGKGLDRFGLLSYILLDELKNVYYEYKVSIPTLKPAQSTVMPWDIYADQNITLQDFKEYDKLLRMSESYFRFEIDLEISHLKKLTIKDFEKNGGVYKTVNSLDLSTLCDVDSNTSRCSQTAPSKHHTE